MIKDNGDGILTVLSGVIFSKKTLKNHGRGKKRQIIQLKKLKENWALHKYITITQTHCNVVTNSFTSSKFSNIKSGLISEFFTLSLDSIPVKTKIVFNPALIPA